MIALENAKEINAQRGIYTNLETLELTKENSEKRYKIFRDLVPGYKKVGLFKRKKYVVDELIDLTDKVRKFAKNYVKNNGYERFDETSMEHLYDAFNDVKGFNVHNNIQTSLNRKLSSTGI